MPVEDHPVHPLTVANPRYGCHNRRPFKTSYIAPNREYTGRVFKLVMVVVKSDMSRDCKYFESDTDPRCKGCKHSQEKMSNESI